MRASPAVVADLGGEKGDILTRLAKDWGCRVELTADAALALEKLEITALR